MKNSLLELVENIKTKSLNIQFPVPGWEGQNFLNTALYYKWLASYIREHKPKRCLELGRRFGNSLYSMSYFLPDSSILDSYDLNNNGKVVNKDNVNVLSYNGDFSKLDFQQYNFIFVDINGAGKIEKKIFDQLIDQNFTGLTAWDDVGSKWCPDEYFWNVLPDDCVKLKYPLHDEYFGFILFN